MPNEKSQHEEEKGHGHGHGHGHSHGDENEEHGHGHAHEDEDENHEEHAHGEGEECPGDLNLKSEGQKANSLDLIENGFVDIARIHGGCSLGDQTLIESKL